MITNEAWSGALSGSVQRGFADDFLLRTEGVNGAYEVSFGRDHDSLPILIGDVLFDQDPPYADPNGTAMALTWDPDAPLLTGRALGAVTETIIPNDFGETGSIIVTANSSPIFDVFYDERDGLGRITKKTESVQGGTPIVYDYEYDHLGRLAKVWVDSVEQATYTYDDNGNRLNDGAQYDDQDRLTSNDQFDFTYTANGELATKTDKTTQDLTTYQYDAFGNLLSVDLPNTTEITYKADGRGRRVAKYVDGVLDQQLIYGSQLQVVAEIAADGTFTRFVYSGKQNVPDYAVRDGVFYRVITDHLGSLRMVVRASDGAVMESRSYDAWGNVSEVASGFHPLPFGFAGGLQDADTGLVRFGARDYDPSVGRWVAKDPIRFFGGDQNLMAYAGNEPVNRTDPRGLDWAQDLWDWGSAAAGAAGGALSQLGGWGAAGVEVGVGAGSVLICGAVFMSDSSTKDLDPPRAPGDPEYCARVKDHCVDACLGELPGEWPFAQCMRDCMASYGCGIPFSSIH